MSHLTTILAWTLALAAGWSLVGARGALEDARAGLPQLPEPRGGELLATPTRPAAPDETAPNGSVAGGEDGEKPAPTRVGDAWQLDFASLEFGTYDPPDLRGEGAPPLPLAAFPPAARELHGQRVALAGFAQVTSFEAGRVRAFVLARYPAGCCFGGLPQYDEWVDVELARDAEVPDGSRPLRAVGRFEVGELLGEEGYVLSLYRLREARLE